jgi:hypothetical protein
MMGRSILHLADLHIGASHAYLAGKAQERAREADAILDRIAEWVVMAGPGSREIGAVLIAGDLFDNPTPPEPLVAQVIRALRRIEGAGIRVITVPGNHDEWTYPDGVYRRNGPGSWPGILVTATAPALVATIELDSESRVEVVSCAFHQGHNPRPEDWKSPFGAGTNGKGSGTRRVGLFHGTCDRLGAFLAEGERAFRLDLDRLASWGLDYVALGHIHRRQDFTSGSCLALYPGPIEGIGFDSPGSLEMTVVEFTEGGMRASTLDAKALGIRLRDIEVFECDPIGITDGEHLESEIAKKADPSRILRVVLTSPPHFALDREALAEKLAPAFYHVELAGADADEAAIDGWEAIASERTLAGTFVRHLIAARDAEAGVNGEQADLWDQAAAAGLHALGWRPPGGAR